MGKPSDGVWRRWIPVIAWDMRRERKRLTMVAAAERARCGQAAGGKARSA